VDVSKRKLVCTPCRYSRGTWLKLGQRGGGRCVLCAVCTVESVLLSVYKYECVER